MTQSALSIISLLVDKNPPVVLDIQRQMLDKGNSLDETTAGKSLQKELFHPRKGREMDIARNQEDLDDARKK